jgi:hypothetical protein
LSRSIKKHPGFPDRNPWAKRKANEKIRHSKDVPNGMAYKKFYESYNIHDYKFIIWDKRDLRYFYRHERCYDWRNDYHCPPPKIPCFKELMNTKLFRDARSK